MACPNSTIIWDTRIGRMSAGILIALLLVVSVVTGTAAAQSAPDCSGVSYNGDGSAANPFEVSNVDQLQCVNQDLDANYVQVSDIDTLETAVWNGGDGFEPIGEIPSSGEQFNGTFEGAGHEITGLTIERRGLGVGLFGAVGPPGKVTNASVRQVDITGSRMGGLVGVNRGAVRDSSASGTVKTESGFGDAVGGLVGVNRGAVQGSSASVEVTDVSKTGGGLVGQNNGIVRGSSASGDVTGVDLMGGLVGQNRGGIVRDSSASGDVSGNNRVSGLVAFNDDGIVQNSSASGDVSGDDLVGGLVGDNFEGTVRESYATGDVSGDNIAVGGLVGRNEDGTVERSYANGSVSGNNEVGGLIGFIDDGTIERSYATGTVSGDRFVGGLVAVNEDGAISESSASGNATGNESVGGFVGLNEGTIEDSYARGAVDGLEKNVGGLVGRNGAGGDAGTVRRSYATGEVTGPVIFPDPIPDPGPGPIEDPIFLGGGLVGNNSVGTVTNSYWDVDTTGFDASEGGTGLNTSEMTGSAASGNMTGFNFMDTWETVPDDYPILSWEMPDSGDTSSPVEGVSDELWTAVTQDDGSDGLSLADLGNAIQEYQKNPSDADVDGVSIGLSDLGSLIQYYRTEVV